MEHFVGCHIVSHNAGRVCKLIFALEYIIYLTSSLYRNVSVIVDPPENVFSVCCNISNVLVPVEYHVVLSE